MAINITRWSPDTCQCVIEYQWDSLVSQDKRVHTVSNIVFACPFHAMMPTIASHYSSVLSENQNKNIALDKVATTIPILTKVDTSGNTILKEGSVHWSFDTSRNLVLSIPTLLPQDTPLLQQVLSSTLGSGKYTLTTSSVISIA